MANIGSDGEDSETEASADGSASQVHGAPGLAHSSDARQAYALCFIGSLLDLGLGGDASVRDVHVELDAPVTHVSCGLDWVCLLTASGRAYSCGLDTYGQLGQGKQRRMQQHQEAKRSGAMAGATLLVPRPLQCPVDQRIVRIACGAAHGGFVTETGALFMFGCASYGRLGIGESASATQPTPVQVHMTWSALQAKVARTSAAVSCGIPVIHAKAASTDAPGSSALAAAHSAPETEESALDVDSTDDDVVFTDISCGDRHTLVLGTRAAVAAATSSSSGAGASAMAKKSIIAFGDGMNGRLGIGNEADQTTGALVTAFKAPQYAKGTQPLIVAIAAGGSHSAALSAAGELFTWGNGASGQLGHGSCKSEWVPRHVTFFRAVALASVKCGAQHTVAVSRAGTVYTWGRGLEGQLGTGDAGLASSSVMTTESKPTAELPQSVRLVIDPLAIQQMSIDAQVHAAAVAVAASASSGGSSSAFSTVPSVASLSQQQLQHQDLRVTVRSIAAGANTSLALDEHARVFAWGSNSDQQLGFTQDEVLAAARRKSLVGCKRPSEMDTSSAASPVHVVVAPKQLLYMNLQARAALSGDSNQCEQPAAKWQTLTHMTASERFSLLVFKTDAVVGSNGGTRGNNGGRGSISGDSALFAALATAVASTNEALPSKEHTQQQRETALQSSRDGTGIGTSPGRSAQETRASNSWHLSLLQDLHVNDVPSKERAYYRLMANYRVYIRRSPSATVTPERTTSAHHLLDLVDCDYDIGERQRPRDVASAGPRRATQRTVSLTQRLLQPRSSAPLRPSLCSKSPTSPVRGVDGWLEKHSPTKPRAQRAFGTASRFPESPTRTSSECASKADELQPASSTRPATAAAVVASSRRLGNTSNRSGVFHLTEPPELQCARPKSAFGRTLRSMVAPRTALAVAPAATPRKPQHIPTSAAPPATTTRSQSVVAPAPAPPRSPERRRQSASAQSRNKQSLKRQLQRQARQLQSPSRQSTGAFGSSVASRFSAVSPRALTPVTTAPPMTPLHPETSAPLVLPTSPRFSMGSGDDYSLLVARRLAQARGPTPGPGTYDRRGG